MTPQIKVGLLPWGQRTDWPSLLRVGQRADELGYDSLWTWDHLYPIQGDWRGPIFEGYMILAGWAGVTSRVTLGLMVGANTFRNPALTAKMVTTLDHMSNGRAILGIGGAWFGREHEAYGLDFGSGFGERLDWLDEAVEVMRAMVDGRGDGPWPALQGEARPQRPAADPGRLPILIGGDGEKKTLHTVAKYADAWNTGGDLDYVRHKDEVLRRGASEVGRDESEIERTLGLGLGGHPRRPRRGRRVNDAFRRQHPGYSETPKMGTAEEIANMLVPYVQLGFRHIFFDAPAPFDEETIGRFVGEVKPMLESAAARAGAQVSSPP